MRRHGSPSTDGNQPLIVAALEAAGAVVTDLSRQGAGVADLLVGFRRRWFLLEVKNPDVPTADQRLTTAQVHWHDAQRLHGAPLFVVLTPQQALRAIGALK